MTDFTLKERMMAAAQRAAVEPREPRTRAWNPDGLLSYDSWWPGAEKMARFLQEGVIYHGLMERGNGTTHAGPVALWQGEPRWQTQFEQMRARILGELYFTPRTPDRGVHDW